MAIVQGLIPPSRENWEWICYVWQFFPLITAIQWVIDWYPQGKTSTESRFNIPGKIGWATMESVGFLLLLVIFYTLPKELGIGELPWGNWTMVGCFVIHYIYRAIISPLFLNPSMSPISPLVWMLAFLFQVFNAISIGGWVSGYGPTTVEDWAGRYWAMEFGLVIWAWGLLGNMFHDDDLREIRRAVDRKQRREAEKLGKAPGNVDKVYMLPKNGLFQYVLFAHYLCEWIEWAGFWMVGGVHCHPARTFLVNEIATMLPRALQGKRWYEKKFGKDKVGSRKAIIPGLI
ncbi:3-oxo-5-alpha-steroid 4-dehydrogenase-like protein [Aaosphaeria arxii CBS 175.79]|uniref:3-oxo-5-alpha-steroid 4-dehydrogenase-like protein n=1 Tax=Aaosphaeria arxii CBS 175.79 TaxID=1450172 RepID=A0A6A5XLE8_9PLEO|nr:3-oxo-5-alpha-steroid 4-dehydrogenase-like protein [Aaosphaeria arxii CBS 175.79]KAF2013763.1 3-oxo-5-alpha-steroid 4-dehydrogenase-like protein [Aaosphaeria arxii CBS 175.79]